MKKISLYILTSTFIITSCGGGGGGGGGGSSTPTPPSSPAPVVNFSASASTAATGELVTLNWSSSNANSCTASGSSDWSGDKGTSGSGDVKVAYGANTFSISCSGSGGTTSRNVTVEGTQIYDESVFVPLGETKSFKGFVFNKTGNRVGCFASVEMDFTNDDGFLFLAGYYSNEWRNLQYDYDDESAEYTSGMRLSEDLIVTEDYEAGSRYRILTTDSGLNGISVSDVQVDPYNYDAPSFEEAVEQFSADIYIDTDYENGVYCNPDMEMGLLAIPHTSPTQLDGAIIGTSESSDGYTFLYLAAKEHWDEYSDNLPSESDIFSTSWAEIDVFTSYLSNPNIVVDNYGFKVKADAVQAANNTDYWKIWDLIGSRYTDTISLEDNSLFLIDDYVTKYLYEGNDAYSNQRMFFKVNVSSDCFRDASRYRDCNVRDYEVLFFTPDKETLLGFKLGGYNGSNNITNAKIILDND